MPALISLQRRSLPIVASVLLVAIATVPAAADTTEDQITGEDVMWVRHDGGTDDAIDLCNDDTDTGGSRRQANEPYSVIDPTDSDTIVTGWNDYCLADLDAGWQGFGYSRDGGQTWFNSFVPGYPFDTSEEGQESPLFGTRRFAGDPIAAFDRYGNLFVGGIAFNRVDDIRGSVYVATYGADDQPISGADDYPADYLRTRIVGEGTPSRNFFGIFQDKPMLEVDRTGGLHDGNVYVCWARFTGAGQNKIFFSRSTDTGETFSRPIALTNVGKVGSVQGCDIAVENDGDVYVTFQTFDDPSAVSSAGLGFVRSTDGGRTFSQATSIRDVRPYFPVDGTRDCGDGPFTCPSDFVFHRVPMGPRVTADQNGELGGLYVIYNEIRPGSTEPSETSYQSAGGGEVGQSLAYVIRSVDDGATWSEPEAINPADAGHQFFADIDALDGSLLAVWQDNRNDPAYDVQFPLGNTLVEVEGELRGVSTGALVVDAFMATSNDGGTTWSTTQASSRAHQSQYEMFGNRDIPFHGDYNWASLAPDGEGGLVGYVAWTDNRDVVEGVDPREDFNDGFDVLQCREELEDGSFGPDTCPNAGGLDQNIYGASTTLQ